MKIFRELFYYKKALAIAVLFGILASSLFFMFALYEINRSDQEKKIMATEHFIVFDNNLNHLVYTNIHLLQGFIAYIQTNDNLNDENVYSFLDKLLESQTDMINNIGILKDTTIIWNYPFEANKESIGQDLSKNEMQKAVVLSVKENLKPVFQGPVNLVQGGVGFIVRYPVTNDDGSYWGQVSIVLKGDAFVKAIQKYEIESNIHSIILSGRSVVYGNERLLEKDIEWFKFNDELFLWDVGIELSDDDFSPNVRIVLFFLLGVIVFLVITTATYLSIRASEIIKHESMHDHLTGLRNRNSLDEIVQQVFSAAIRNNHKAGILLLDLNKFKDINDTFGHSIGDEVLIETSNRLKAASRSDEVIFRIGGDEFLLVVPVVNDSLVLDSIKERLKSHLAYRLNMSGYNVTVTSSIGCAIYPDDGEDFDEVFQIADKRMYKEKNEVI